jgi:DNA modification methylase
LDASVFRRRGYLGTTVAGSHPAYERQERQIEMIRASIPMEIIPSCRIIVGDICDIVPRLPIVHCVVTSPPYFDKMEYGDSDHEVGRRGSSVDDYVSTLCDLLDAIPLHELGSVWVNIGDKRGYKGGLIGVPSMFSLEMRRRGWLLMDDIIWAKGVTERDGSIVGNFMTEPAPNRLNGNGWENVFRFARIRRAWTDMQAVAVPRHNVHGRRHLPQDWMRVHTDDLGRRPTNVWRMPQGRTGKRHFAAMPPDLPERAIAMTCPPWVNPDGTLPSRIVEMVEYDEGRGGERYTGKRRVLGGDDDKLVRARSGRADTGTAYRARYPKTVGWTDVSPHATPGIVLDPFAGVGTVGEVALRMGRAFIGVELYGEFAADTDDRCMRVPLRPPDHGVIVNEEGWQGA